MKTAKVPSLILALVLQVLPVTLAAGTNTFQIRATDAAGNSSLTNTRVVVYKLNLPLALTINGSGTVAGASNGQLIEIGKAVTLKATPKPGNVFSNWLVNGGSSTAATLAVTMSSNLTVVANFLTTRS
jgi:Divergent InlB B-repeat domain